jgi:putative ABC transport system substrate-binding protein
LLAAFREGLQALGYQEGQNLVIEYRWGEGKVDRLPALAKELVEQNVDVIVSGGFVGAQAAKNATREIPIVAAGVGDLVESGLVNNLARPDGNLTGFIAAAPETAAKRLQMIKEINPLARHIAVLRNPTATIHLEWKVIQRARSDLDLTFALYEANNVEELASALIAISKEHPDFIFILNDPFAFTYRKKISDAAAQAKLPAIYGFREFVDDGGLISYGPRFLIPTVALPLTWTKFLAARKSVTCRSKNRRNSSWSSTLRPLRISASRSRPRSSPAPTR